MGWKDRAYYRDDDGQVPPVVFAMPKPPRLTTTLIVVNLAIFVAQAVTRDPNVIKWGGLTFLDGVAFTQPWRWITYQYLHGGALHIFMNMLALYFFLPALEMMWGWKKAFAFYTLGGIVSGITFGLLCLVFGRQSYLFGASGAVLATLGAVALLSPQRQLILLVFPVPIRVAAALFGAYYLLSAFADRNLSDAAHLGGLAFGFFAPWFGGPVLRKTMRKWERRREQNHERAEREAEQQIDQILQKVHREGMNSLTRSEKKALQRETERKRQSEEARRR